MKRTKAINLERMRKQKPAVKPLLLAMSATTLLACDSKTPATVYQDVDHCIQDTGLESRCEAAYEKALRKSRLSGPKYRSESDCEAEFGHNNCEPYQMAQGARYIPRMGGFMLSREGEHYRSAPVYSSFNRYSRYHGRWSSLEGDDLGRRQFGDINVSSSNFASKPVVTNTLSRGGFGARSSYSGGSSWGG